MTIDELKDNEKNNMKTLDEIINGFLPTLQDTIRLGWFKWLYQI